jgi:hypothetical protein
VQNSIKYILLLLFSIIYSSLLFAQKTVDDEDDKTNIIEQRVEYLLENSDDTEGDFTTIFENLLYYYEHPINLNNTNYEELSLLGLLTDIQIKQLLDHIAKYGKLLTIYELQTIPSFDLETIRLILPFVKVSGSVDKMHVSFKEMMQNGNHQLFIRASQILEEKKGFSPADDSTLNANPNARYLGSPLKLYTRYKFNYGTNISVGFTTEKDAGESFNKGFDFYSAHAFFRGEDFIRQVAVGDYQVEIGQGLTFWTSRAFRKNANIMLIKRSGQILRPYTSVDENKFLRGAAVTLAPTEKITVTAFGSSNKIDGNANTSDTLNTDEDIFTSFQTSGLHRTYNELADKDALTDNIMGGYVRYNQRQFVNIGVSGVYRSLSGPIMSNKNLYAQNRFSGNQNFVTGLDYNIVKNNWNAFGEFSRSQSGGIAFTSGVLSALSQNFSLAALYRNIQPDFQQIYSNAITESSTTENEKGLYLGFQASLPKKFYVSAYFDQFTFPWLKYQVNAPSNGHQLLAQLNYTPSRKLDIYFRVRGRKRQKNTKQDNVYIDYLTDEYQTNYRWNLDYKVSESVRLKTRIEYVVYQLMPQNPETGYLLYQDVIYKALSSPVQITYRFGLFDTDSYNARIYAFENDVLYAFSIPAYYYKGTRQYLLLRYTLKKGIDIWLRYAVTTYTNVSVIGSGLEEITGNTKSEIKAQLRIKF